MAKQKRRKETALEEKARLNREATAKYHKDWLRLFGAGVSLSEIGRRYGVDRRIVADALGRPTKPNTPISGAGRQRNLQIDPALYEKAAERALALGLTVESGQHAGKGSVASMVELIGAGHLIVDFADVGDERDEQTA